MKKLNAKEILEIIEENYSEYAFAHNEWDDVDSIKGCPDFEYIEKERDDFYAKHQEKFRKLSWSEREQDPDWKTYSSMPSKWDKKREFVLNYLGLGKVVEIDQYGGEGQGDHWYSVKHFVDHDVYIKITGHYSSYHGTDFYDGYGKEVKPKEKTITVFE